MRVALLGILIVALGVPPGTLTSDARASATTRRGAEAADGAAAAVGSGEAAGASAAGDDRGAIERGEY